MLVFDSWQVGQSFVKNIVVKNMLFTTVRITPTAPTGAFFALKHPATQLLISPGTSITITVIFQPQETVDYDAALSIVTPSGPVVVALQAHLPRPELVLPAQVAFATVSVGLSSVKKFVVKNPGAETVTWNLSLDSSDAPFTLAPTFGQLSPGSECTVSVTFAPLDARTHNSNLVLKTDGKFDMVAPIIKIVPVSGRAMYAHVSLEGLPTSSIPGFYLAPTVQQGTPAAAARCRFTLKNCSGVVAAYTVQHQHPFSTVISRTTPPMQA